MFDVYRVRKQLSYIGWLQGRRSRNPREGGWNWSPIRTSGNGGIVRKDNVWQRHSIFRWNNVDKGSSYRFLKLFLLRGRCSTILLRL
jgi:hypothetical protein